MKAGLVAGGIALLVSCASGGGVTLTGPPDVGRRVVAEHAAIATADAHASEAGLHILRAGGNAVDAAVAAAFAIGVVEPQMSGVGGSGAMTIWRQDVYRADYLDFYAAQNADTWRAAFAAGRVPDGDGGSADLRIVGVPGNVAGLLAAHERFGILTRQQVMAPAIQLAEDGFPVSQILAEFIISSREKLSRFEASMRLMYPDGEPLAPGQRLRNPELAATLRRISERGAAGFYEGETARALIAALNAGANPATATDLTGYTVQWERPLCSYYRGRVLLSAPPPQSGSQVLHTLELIEPHDMAALGLPTRSAESFDIMASALRVGIADNRVNGDPNWQPVPAAGIVSQGFGMERGTLVGAATVPDSVPQADATAHDADGVPPQCVPFEPYGATPAITSRTGGAGSGAIGSARAAAPRSNRMVERAASPVPGTSTDDLAETTHISVVDGDGNAVSLTQTNSTVFGSGANVGGFFLNDSGFRFTPQNIDLPSRTPWITRRTTIAPTLVLHGGEIVMVVGAPGGGLIPTSMVQAIVYALDYGMDPLDAIRMPRLFPSPDTRAVQIETGFASAVLEAASEKGWTPVSLAPGYARIYMVMRRGGRWIAVADPRHNGEARGY
jgi:gamma-glutamyltranspeptidase/glutathione hydrolase